MQKPNPSLDLQNQNLIIHTSSPVIHEHINVWEAGPGQHWG